MKAKIYSLAALLCIVLAVGCKKETAEPASNLPKNTQTVARLSPDQLDYIAAVGDQHTKGLQYAYNYLVTLKSTSPSTFDSAIHLLPALKAGMHSFYSGNELEWIANNSDSVIYYADDAFDEANVKLHQDPDYWESHSLWKPEQDASLSPVTKSLLNDLQGIMLDSTKTLQQSLDEIAALEITANNDPALDSQELALVLSATSVGKSSLQYWLQNYSQWSNLIGTSTVWKVATNRSASACARSAGVADVAGTVGGAVYVGIYSLFSPVTAAFAFGTIIATGISCSVIAAISTWLS